MEHGFKDSPFRFLNKIPASVDTWNEEMIKNRQNQIVDKALQIWKMPQTDLVVDKNREELIDYDGDYSQFSSIKLKGYSFLDDNFVATKSWLDLYLDVINKLYEENPNPISEASLTEEKHNRLASMFRNTEVPGYSTKIDEEIHVMSNLSNADKFLIINDLLAAYNYPYDSLKVAIVGNKKEEE